MGKFIHDIGQFHIYINDVMLENLSRDSKRDITKEENLVTMDNNCQGYTSSVNQSFKYLLTIDVIQGTDSKAYLDKLFTQAKANGKFSVKYEERRRGKDSDEIYIQINELYMTNPSNNILTQDAAPDQYSFEFHMSDCPIFRGEPNKAFSNFNI